MHLNNQTRFIPYHTGIKLKFVRGKDDYRYCHRTCRKSDIKPCLSKLDLAESLWIMAIGRIDFLHHLEDRHRYYNNNYQDLSSRLQREYGMNNPLAYLALLAAPPVLANSGKTNKFTLFSP